jgi:hypothetical protein
VQIETFDPHEPFFTLPEHKAVYDDFYEKSRDLIWDWPGYESVKEVPEEIALMRHNYASLMTLCDSYVGKVIDLMDELDLWSDTMLIVWTDHGFCLGEHDCWAKCWLPFYEEIARTPFFIWDPRTGIKGQIRSALVQPSIDLGPTLLEFFGLEPTADMTGKSLLPVIKDDSPIRETAIFGMFGAQVNITDGRYVYMRGPVVPSNRPLYEYTLMPAHMRAGFSVDELQDNEIAQPFSFMKGVAPVKIEGFRPPSSSQHTDRGKTLLYDLQSDPGQQSPINDQQVEKRLIKAMIKHMADIDAPAEQFTRLGL